MKKIEDRNISSDLDNFHSISPMHDVAFQPTNADISSVRESFLLLYLYFSFLW